MEETYLHDWRTTQGAPRPERRLSPSGPAGLEQCCDVPISVEAVLDHPTHRADASHRPPGCDDVHVNLIAIASKNVGDSLLVPDREYREIEGCVPGTRVGPVDDTGDRVAVVEDVGRLVVAMGEGHSERSEGRCGTRPR